MTSVKLDVETLDRITIAGLKHWRREILEDNSKHPSDILQSKVLAAAIDMLLAYSGGK